ncbi:response regulator transcription factor [Paenibacillus periandrae]|uniref:response regulator transcription factor n=1 Tax=Paenibacillus periandrae TaxID=1761741 RepID=UPI001F08B56C|nr:response regulator transcription factor [Paenibacillus periandrae]
MNRDKKLKTLVVDQHIFVAEATKSALKEIEDIVVMDIALDDKQCREKMAEHEPDLVILDYFAPGLNGLEIIEHIKLNYPATKIVIFTGEDITKLFNRLVKLEVDSILSKESNAKTFKNMVECVLDNQSMIPISIFHQLSLNTKNDMSDMTKEEILIMNMIAKGFTQDKIAERISVSKRSVDNYLKRIYLKLEVKTRLEAIEKFVKSELYHENFKIEI